MATVAEKILELKPVIDGVYNAGKEDGHGVGYSKGYGLGYAAGEKAAIKAFWDGLLNKPPLDPNKGVFFATFGSAWTEDTFKPTADIVATDLYMGFAGNQLTSIKASLDKCGVKLDTSKCWRLSHAFYYAQTQSLGTIDTRSCTSLISTFYNCPNLYQLALILKDDGTQTFPDTFKLCSKLHHLSITGKIGQNVDFHWSANLSPESLSSILTSLLSGAGKTITLPLAAVNKAYETSEGAMDGTESQEWLTTITRPALSSWKFNLL